MWARKIIGIYGILCIPENKIYIGKVSPSDLKNYLNDSWSFGVYRG